VLAGTVVGRELRISIDLSSPVAMVGGVARTQGLVGNGLFRDVLIARIDPQSFSTLNATCTHEGCVVSRFAAPLYECPCHGSRYDLLGAVVRGPAPAALPQLAASYAQGFLRITI
jgi:Rieske Fe-S protein